MSTHNTIVVKGTGVNQEALANAEITPGHLVELMSTGKFKVHATAGGNAAKIFAVEDELQGNPISTAYDAGDLVQARHMRPGEWVQAIAVSQGSAIVIGDFVESAAGGTLQKHVADVSDSPNTTNQIIGIAREAIDNSDSAADAIADSRFLVEIV